MKSSATYNEHLKVVVTDFERNKLINYEKADVRITGDEDGTHTVSINNVSTMFSFNWEDLCSLINKYKGENE